MRQRAGWVAVVLFFMGTLSVAGWDDKVPDIHDIMSKSNKRNGLKDQVVNEARKPNPNWATVQTKAKELAELSESLPKNSPPRGSEESWKKLAKEYVEAVKEMREAADKKDKAKVLAANTKLTQGCKTCHDLHQD